MPTRKPNRKPTNPPLPTRRTPAPPPQPAPAANDLDVVAPAAWKPAIVNEGDPPPIKGK